MIPRMNGKELTASTLCVGPGLKPHEIPCPNPQLMPARCGVMQPRCAACMKKHLVMVRQENTRGR